MFLTETLLSDMNSLISLQERTPNIPVFLLNSVYSKSANKFMGQVMYRYYYGYTME